MVSLSTPKALANFSLGLEHSDNPRIRFEKCINPERVSSAANPFRVHENVLLFPRGSRFARTPG